MSKVERLMRIPKKFTPDINRKIFIINVGVNSRHGALRSPIFKDGTFLFIPIPETREPQCPLLPTYRELVGPANLKYIPQRFYDVRVHNDPEFESFTYGDFPEDHPRAANLKKISRGDYLFFLANLTSYDCNKEKFLNRKGFYLIGFFEIEKVLRNVNEKPSLEDLKIFGNNAHIKRRLWKVEAFGRSWIFKGSKNSRLFKYAVPFAKAIAEKLLLYSKGENWEWPNNRGESQIIGSYFRSCRIIERKEAIKLLWEWVRKYNEI